MNIENALRDLLPEPKFDGVLFTREDYERGIKWIDDRPKPSWEDLVSASIRLANAENEAAEQKASQLNQAEQLREEYSITAYKNMSLLELQKAVREQLSKAGGVERAIEQLAIAVSLLERRVYGKL